MPLDNDKIAKIMAEAQRMRRNRVSNEKINAFVDRSLDKLRQEMSAKADADLKKKKEAERLKKEAEEKAKKLEEERKKIKGQPVNVLPPSMQKPSVSIGKSEEKKEGFKNDYANILPKPVKETPVKDTENAEQTQEDKKIVANRPLVLGSKPATNALIKQQNASPIAIADAISQEIAKKETDKNLAEAKKMENLNALEKTKLQLDPDGFGEFKTDSDRLEELKNKRAWNKSWEKETKIQKDAEESFEKNKDALVSLVGSYSKPAGQLVNLAASVGGFIVHDLFGKPAAAITAIINAPFTKGTTDAEEAEIGKLEEKVNKQKLPLVTAQLAEKKEAYKKSVESGKNTYVTDEAYEDMITRLEEEKNYLEGNRGKLAFAQYLFDDGLAYFDMPLDVKGDALRKKIEESGYESLTEEEKEVFNVLKDREEILGASTSDDVYNVAKGVRHSAEFIGDIAIGGVGTKVVKKVTTKVAEKILKKTAAEIFEKALQKPMVDVIGTAALQPSTWQNAEKESFADVQRVVKDDGTTTAVASNEQKLALAEDLGNKLAAVEWTLNNYKRNFDSLSDEDKKEYEKLLLKRERIKDARDILVDEVGNLQVESSSGLRHIANSLYSNALEGYSERIIGMKADSFFKGAKGVVSKGATKYIPKTTKVVGKIADKAKTITDHSSYFFKQNRALRNLSTLGGKYTPMVNSIPSEMVEEIFVQAMPDIDKNSDYKDKIAELGSLDFYTSVALTSGLLVGSTTTLGLAGHKAMYALNKDYREETKKQNRLRDTIESVVTSTDSKEFFDLISNATVGNKANSQKIIKELDELEKGSGKFSHIPEHNKKIIKENLERNLIENMISDAYASGTQDHLEKTFSQMSTSKAVSPSMQVQALKALERVQEYTKVVEDNKNEYNANNLINLEIRKRIREKDKEVYQKGQTEFLNAERESILKELESVNETLGTSYTIDDILKHKSKNSKDNELFLKVLSGLYAAEHGQDLNATKEEIAEKGKRIANKSNLLNLVSMQDQISNVDHLLSEIDSQLDFQRDAANRPVIEQSMAEEQLADALNKIESLTEISEGQVKAIKERIAKSSIGKYPAFVARVDKAILDKQQKNKISEEKTEETETPETEIDKESVSAFGAVAEVVTPIGVTTPSNVGEQTVMEFPEEDTPEEQVLEQDPKKIKSVEQTTPQQTESVDTETEKQSNAEIEKTGQDRTKEPFKTKIEQFNYTYNPETEEVIHNSKKGDKIVTAPATIGKVLAEYAKEHKLRTESFNKQTYAKVGSRFVNINNGKLVTQKEIADKFKEGASNVPTNRAEALIQAAENDSNNVVVEHKGREYIVNNNGVILSKNTKRVVKFNNAEDTKAVLEKAEKKRSKQDSSNLTSEQIEKPSKAKRAYESSTSGGITLNQGQQNALDSFINFLDEIENNPEAERQFLLKGRGGTGKSTIAGKMLEEAKKMGYTIYATAISDAATSNLRTLTNNYDSLKDKVVISNFASMYGLVPVMDENGVIIKYDIPTGEELMDTVPKIKAGKNLLLFDEASMVSRETLNIIKKISPDTIIVFMGDNAQIKPIGDSAISEVFNLKNRAELTEVMRQKSGSPILELATNVAKELDVIDNKENIKLSPVATLLKTDFEEKTNSGVIVSENTEEFLNEAAKDFKAYGVKETIIVTGNVNNVNKYNREIRKRVVGEDTDFVVPGERVMLYSKYSKYVGKNHPRIEIFNSSVVDVTSVRNASVLGIPVLDITVNYTREDGTQGSTTMKVIHKNNKEAINLLFEKKKELHKDWMEFKKGIGKKDKQTLIDETSLLSQTVLIDYNYAMTAHKVQGQTVRNTYVDPTYRGFEKTEARRMFYTSITRPTNKLFVLSDSEYVDPNQKNEGISVDEIFSPMQNIDFDLGLNTNLEAEDFKCKI